MLTFESSVNHGRGTIARLLRLSYAAAIPTNPSYWEKEQEKWMKYDRDVFENPDTVGRCTFVSVVGDVVVGCGSFDPRGGPDFAVIGHNCILPDYRGRGFGRRQVEEICERLRSIRIGKALVSTGDHPFFIPAQKMYLSCGFSETGRKSGGGTSDPPFRLIEYEKNLSD
jgi:GNAT superfamily N-acetyltransferase